MTEDAVARVIGRADDLALWRQTVAAVVRAGGRIADTGHGEGGAQGVEFIRFRMGTALLSLERDATAMILRGDAEAVAAVVSP